jgi:SnoaL-like protein
MARKVSCGLCRQGGVPRVPGCFTGSGSGTIVVARTPERKGVLVTGYDQVLERHAVEDAARAYGLGCDDRDMAALRRIFTDDAEARYGELRISGAENIVAWLAERTASMAYSQHVITPTRIEIDGDTATCHAALIAHQVFANAPETVQVTVGDYRLRLRRLAGRWRIAELVLTVGWSGRRE